MRADPRRPPVTGGRCTCPVTGTTATARRRGAAVPPRAAAALGLALAAVLATAACAEDPPVRTTPPPPARVTTAVEEEPAPAAAAPVTGPTAQDVADALDAVSPIRHPRDNTGSCAAKGCLGLVTAGTVSVYRWADAPTATRFAGDGGAADRVGAYVLSYRTREQRSTPPAVRAAYVAKVRELVGPAA